LFDCPLTCSGGKLLLDSMHFSLLPSMVQPLKLQPRFSLI
jgi:hypothetical protein